jgi:hypothetical protein
MKINEGSRNIRNTKMQFSTSKIGLPILSEKVREEQEFLQISK